MIDQNILTQAYKEQKAFVNQKLTEDNIAGYKAAVSSPDAQKALGLPSLITGVLYTSGIIQNNTTIQLSNFNYAKIETEIGFIINQELSAKVDKTQLPEMVSAVLPVFEIPDIIANDVLNTPIVETIAKNGFSSHFVVGKFIELTTVDVNSICPKLFLNDQPISEGKATDAMNDQWKALELAINQSIEQGYTIQKDDIIITGALGKILPIEPGKYFADYGDLGSLEIMVE